MKLSKFLVDFKECELLNINDIIEGGKKEEYIEVLKFWNREVEDRDIVLEDLDKDNGILYKLLCDWNEDKFIIKNGLGFSCWEYSLEDFFRDMFYKSEENKEGNYNLFEMEDINRMMYGEEQVKIIVK